MCHHARALKYCLWLPMRVTEKMRESLKIGLGRGGFLVGSIHPYFYFFCLLWIAEILMATRYLETKTLFPQSRSQSWPSLSSLSPLSSASSQDTSCSQPYIPPSSSSFCPHRPHPSSMDPHE